MAKSMLSMIVYLVFRIFEHRTYKMLYAYAEYQILRINKDRTSFCKKTYAILHF